MDSHYGQCDLILFVVLCFWFVLIIFAPVTTIVALIATNEFNLLNRQRDDERALDINEFVACSKDDTYMEVKKTRLKKTAWWVNNRLTLPRLAACITSIEPIILHMVQLFSSARRTQETHMGYFDFCSPLTSPAAKIFDAQRQAMRDNTHSCWRLVRGLSGWTSEKRMLASVSVYTAWGQSQIRFRKRFFGSLGLLGEVVAPTTEPARRAQLGTWFMHCDAECCLAIGFADHIRRVVKEPADLQKPGVKNRIISTLSHARVDNINNENRFARHSTHRSTSHGAAAAVSTISAGHVLAEQDTVHRAKLVEYASAVVKHHLPGGCPHKKWGHA